MTVPTRLIRKNNGSNAARNGTQAYVPRPGDPTVVSGCPFKQAQFSTALSGPFDALFLLAAFFIPIGAFNTQRDGRIEFETLKIDRVTAAGAVAKLIIFKTL